ncbi:MAG: amino acid ABC transporter permease [Pikeienuella sp.]
MTASTHQADPRFSEAPAPRETFRLDMLWTDARYRSLFIQIVAFMLLMLAVGWLISNMFSNLERLGKDLNFSFLFSEANYDINQRLVTYESTDSHGRAALVGMLNTLLVSFLGCIAATLIGVIAGVLRLSKNWVVSSLMTVYIEVVRNVPLLLQILLTYAILIEVLPQPREFRENVAEPERATLWFDMIAATNRGFFLPRPVFEDGMGMVGLAVLASIVGFFLFNWGRRAYQNAMGTEMPGLFVLLGMLFAPVAGLATALLFMPTALLADGPDGFLARLSASDTATMINAGGATLTGLILAALLFRAPVTSVRTAILFVPGITVYYLLGQPMSWIFPELRGFNFVAGEDAAIHARNSLVALWLALSIYTGAFIAEIVRGGILAIPKGQTEAAGALGLRPNRIMSLVILPQALRVIIPPQISQYLNLTKNSSLAIAVGYMDVTGTLGGITLNQTGREMECILLLMAFYLTISLTISGVINVFNERVKLKER